ncbi:MAG: hypothetical protein QE271_08580 [Bacteriovoracaceae bacterium]|nr:hypothetical protein [Bacteriovoracaceae bacterium]
MSSSLYLNQGLIVHGLKSIDTGMAIGWKKLRLGRQNIVSALRCGRALTWT